jgi:uncharacterized protein (TIGR02147 family)
MLDYREHLSQAFASRTRANPRYSLRAFARDIGLSPSRLSEVMAGKGDLSREKAAVVAAKLKFSKIESTLFLDLVDGVSGATQKLRDAAMARAKKRTETRKKSILDEQKFELVANPVYVAIWSYMHLPLFDGSPQMIAFAFKLNVIEMYAALRKLEAAGLVIRDGAHWRASKGDFSVGDALPSHVIRSYHKQISALGRDSIEGFSMQVRHLDSLVMPFDSRRFGEVQQKIAAFAQSLIDEFGKGETDTVYGLSLQFFPMIAVTQRSPMH